MGLGGAHHPATDRVECSRCDDCGNGDDAEAETEITGHVLQIANDGRCNETAQYAK